MMTYIDNQLMTFSQDHPYINQAMTIIGSNCVEAGVGYLCGRLVGVSPLSCVKVLVTFNIFKQIISVLYSYQTDWNAPDALLDYQIQITLYSAAFAGISIAHLARSDLIGLKSALY